MPNIRIIFALVAVIVSNFGLQAIASPTEPTEWPKIPAEFSRVFVPLASWLATRRHAYPGSIRTLTHEANIERAFRTAVQAMVAGQWSKAVKHAGIANYEIIAIVESGRWYAVLQERGAAGLGPTVVISPNPKRDLIAEAPHSAFETGTPEEAALFVTHLGARAAIISGSHRCAAWKQTGCSGKTRVCNSKYREAYRDSDVAHNPNSLFQIAHDELVGAWLRSLVVSLHGMRKTHDPLVIVSDGSKESRQKDDALSGLLRNALRRELGGQPELAVSCNDKEDRKYRFRKLCGFTNVQGRSLNRSADVCTQNALSSSGRFLHVEQTWDILGQIVRGWPNLAAYPKARAIFNSFKRISPCISRKCAD